MRIKDFWGDLEYLPEFENFKFLFHDYSRKPIIYAYEYFDFKKMKDLRITFEVDLEGRGKALEWEVKKLITQEISEYMI